MGNYSRRKKLIDHMLGLEAENKTCLQCPGTCCTYEANSMQVSPIEVHDILTYLKNNDLHRTELKKKLEATVQTYRLDKMISTGRKSSLRRTYTCTFFNQKELGCALPREVKPYGCLAFNAHHHSIKAQEFCYSDQNLLEKDESNLNLIISKQWNLWWEKLPLPVALLDVWHKDLIDLSSADDQESN